MKKRGIAAAVIGAVLAAGLSGCSGYEMNWWGNEPSSEPSYSFIENQTLTTSFQLSGSAEAAKIEFFVNDSGDYIELSIRSFNEGLDTSPVTDIAIVDRNGNPVDVFEKRQLREWDYDMWMFRMPSSN